MKRLFTVLAVLTAVATVHAQSFLDNRGTWGRPSQLAFAEYQFSTNSTISITNTDTTVMRVPMEAVVYGAQWGNGTNAAYNATNTISAKLAISGYHTYNLGTWTGQVVGSESPIMLNNYPPIKPGNVLTLTDSPAITTNVTYVGIWYFDIPLLQ